MSAGGELPVATQQLLAANRGIPIGPHVDVAILSAGSAPAIDIDIDIHPRASVRSVSVSAPAADIDVNIATLVRPLTASTFVARVHLRASIAPFFLRCARIGTLPAAVLATSARFAGPFSSLFCTFSTSPWGTCPTERWRNVRARPINTVSAATPHLHPLPSAAVPPAQGRRLAARAEMGWASASSLPGMVEAFAKLPTHAAILDGELCLIDPRGSAHFYRLMAHMRTSHPDESQLMFMAVDLLHQDGVDFARLTLVRAQARSASAVPQIAGAVHA